MPTQAENQRPIATVRSYDELMTVLRARAEERRVSRETIDGDCKFPDRYATKLLGPSQIRHLGDESFGALLAYLKLEMVLVEVPETQ